ncbi:MAG TPA: hypothetical protein PKI11_12120 [Candidatus Hydrogenedentes bacterium]|nr:hypothetical protein [Candidatus Hydrogenedentota bacterium]
MDWTDRDPFQQLVFSLPHDGRALPFLGSTMRKGTSEDETKGRMIAAETQAMDMLERLCPTEVRPVIIADRGFGHPRRLKGIQKRGWYFVQRFSCIHQVSAEQHMGTLKELGIGRGWRARDWGWGTMDEQEFGPIRLITVFEREAEEAWYLVTNLEVSPPRKSSVFTNVACGPKLCSGI